MPAPSLKSGAIEMVVPPYGENGPDVRIRKVKVLQGGLRAQADKKGLTPDDLVLVKTTIKPHQLPIYEIEKVGGDPVSFLLKRAGREARPMRSEGKTKGRVYCDEGGFSKVDASLFKKRRKKARRGLNNHG